jgi:G8 domain/Prenyltransferase and squalene oxidase repeat
MGRLTVLTCGILTVTLCATARAADEKPAGHPPHSGHNHAAHGQQHAPVEFSIRSVRDGHWSDPRTWQPERVPASGDRVLVSRETRVLYNVDSPDVIRLVQVAGTLEFARDRSTLLNVGLVKIQNSAVCSESGFACDFHSINDAGEPHAPPEGRRPALLVGTPEAPIPAPHTARIRLHYLDGMHRDDAPAIACCSGRMELHGAPLSRTWVKLGTDAEAGASTVTLSEPVSGWRPGDEVIITGSVRKSRGRTFRNNPEAVTTEERRITSIDGTSVQLDRPLDYAHRGSGEFRCEIANLSRNVIIESADPEGVRGHTVYHRFSQGGISYARFAHLGKEGVLGRYAIHFHLVGATMRGSSVVGAAIVDSHNRWVTIHGTHYLVVRDCVGYQSVGHGFFLEDATEVYNLLDRNLGVQACRGRRLPEQVLPFDPNDGAAFWWSNGRNTLVRNVSCENDEYGFRYDMQTTSRFDGRLLVRMPDGSDAVVDVRTIPIWRFEDNEAHNEGFYGLLVAANGNRQPDTAIRDESMLRQIERVDWTGPDVRHPHVIRNLKLWNVHYALRPHSPAMLLENIRIHDAAYGIYRPAFENQVYRNLHLSDVAAEPFNRGMDDASAQTGRMTVDGLIFENFNRYGLALVQMTDNNLGGAAECHFRGVELRDVDPRRPTFDRGGGAKADPVTPSGVPYYVHDWFGPGRHARVVSSAARDLRADGLEYRPVDGLTGEESLAAEVQGVEFPQLLDPVDDLPPATMMTSIRTEKDQITVRGLAHDNGRIVSVLVNDRPAEVLANASGVVDWKVSLLMPADRRVTALAIDEAGNRELTPHVRVLPESGGLAATHAAPAGTEPAHPDMAEIRSAIRKSLDLLQHSGAEYRRHRECFSCHHQALPVMALAEARRRDFAIDTAGFEQQLDHTLAHLERGRQSYLKGIGQGGKADTAGYALWTLEEGGRPSDENTAAVTAFLLDWQQDKGHWKATSHRPPSEASAFTTTYLAVRALGAFGTPEQQARIAERRAAVLEWLATAEPEDTEDRVFQLRTLGYLHSDEDRVREPARELLELQRPDGGWAQTPEHTSDPYATATALVALHEYGGLAGTDEAYQRGLIYLLNTQHDDGSWHVVSRSKPFQTYFETGFPHGKDQFISAAASSWASIALLKACEPDPTADPIAAPRPRR